MGPGFPYLVGPPSLRWSLALGEAWPAPRFPFWRPGTRPRPEKAARPAACPAGLSSEGAGALALPDRPPGAMATTGPARRARVTHSAVASAGMRSAGPSVRSPGLEQLTRQAAPGAGPQRQGRVRPAASARGPRQRPEPQAQAQGEHQVAGAAGGIPGQRKHGPGPPRGPERPGSRRPRLRRSRRTACGLQRDLVSGGGRGLFACATASRRSGPAGSSAASLARWRCSAARPLAPPSSRRGAGRGALRPRPRASESGAAPGGCRGGASEAPPRGVVGDGRC